MKLGRVRFIEWASMTLEEFTAQQNGVIFWKEFTFSQLKFRVAAGELELADNLVWFADVSFIIQMKERTAPTDEPENEKKWFDNKILNSAVKQIKDSMRLLKEHGSIPVSNVRGQRLEIRGAELREIRKIIVYKAGNALPPECRHIQYKTSQSAGFIHIFDQADYGRVLNTLIAPEEIRRYLNYRESCFAIIEKNDFRVAETDILAAYASEEPHPNPLSHIALDRLVEEIEHFNLSSILGKLAEQIENPESSGDYSKIMEEFAKLPRSAWAAAKQRFDLSCEAARTGQFVQPFRFYFPETNCSFMFTPLHPDAPHGALGTEFRSQWLLNLTEAAKYLSKADRGVGVQVSFDGTHFFVDWCLANKPWTHNPDMERLVADSPFRPVREQKIDGFFFRRLT